ncbi:pirin family protein [uncultured Paraglaciecola sp.]|uniref:pirin family protein n=1 Tax=uncultured Paraglaciecola sp. TaxID=1765024 RepID=UPI00261A94A4|nr:pirin family protein [uncultured Paraglaciecola sp.]
MFVLRQSSQRGSADHGWLKSQHSFSFANYYDPVHMGFSKLRVINEDIVQLSMGFGTHGHQDMEILSYVLQGDIVHKDSQGNVRTLPSGEFQLMSAGSGITYSEYNHSNTGILQFLQIWIEPNIKGQAPGYQQKDFEQNEGLTHVISPNGANDTLQVKQDIHLYQLILSAGQSTHLTSTLPNQYLHLISGKLDINGFEIGPGDGFKITDEVKLVFKSIGEENVKALIFELPY